WSWLVFPGVGGREGGWEDGGRGGAGRGDSRAAERGAARGEGEESGLILCPVEAEAGVELGVAEPPPDHEESAPAHPLPGLAGRSVDGEDIREGDEELPCAVSGHEQHGSVAVPGLGEGGPGPGSETLGDDPLERLLGEGGRDVDAGGAQRLSRELECLSPSGGPGQRGQVLLGASASSPSPHHEGEEEDEQEKQQKDRDEPFPHRSSTLPSRTVGRPARTVSRFRPGSSRPAKGELRLREACSVGSTTRTGRGSQTSTCAGSPA